MLISILVDKGVSVGVGALSVLLESGAVFIASPLQMDPDAQVNLQGSFPLTTRPLPGCQGKKR
jgi:hypothetical protein